MRQHAPASLLFDRRCSTMILGLQHRSADRDNVAQLKGDIDSGRTGDKIAFPDPGLSPLGTDDEAAGRPASAERVALARRQEALIGALAKKDDPSPQRGRYIPVLIMAVVVVIIAATAVAAVMMRR